MDIGYNIYELHDIIDDAVRDCEKENESLRGLIRRLEKSNQELGEENHRLKGNGEGWNKNV